HQLVPRGVEFHLVDPVAEPVVGAQHGRVLIGKPGLALRLRQSRQQAELAHLGHSPAGALPLQRGQQRRIAGHVVPGQRRGLIDDLVGKGLSGNRPRPLLPARQAKPSQAQPRQATAISRARSARILLPGHSAVNPALRLGGAGPPPPPPPPLPPPPRPPPPRPPPPADTRTVQVRQPIDG